jgi:Lipocalin-like domain
MNRSVSDLSVCLGLVAGVVLGGASAGAQQPSLQQASLKERLVGTWTVVSQYTIAPDGKREEVYGAKPIGRLTFDAGGRFSYTLFNPGRPKFASRDKNKGTAEEYAVAVQGGQAYFGTFSVSEANDRIVYHIEGALEPSWQGTDRTGASVTLIDDELKYNATTPATGVTAYQVWKRMK